MRLFVATWVLVGLAAGVVFFAADVPNAFFAAALTGLLAAALGTLARVVQARRRRAG